MDDLLSPLLSSPSLSGLLAVAGTLLLRRLKLIPDVAPAKPDADAVSAEVKSLQDWAAKAVTGAARVSTADKEALTKLLPVLGNLAK